MQSLLGGVAAMMKKTSKIMADDALVAMDRGTRALRLEIQKIIVTSLMGTHHFPVTADKIIIAPGPGERHAMHSTVLMFDTADEIAPSKAGKGKQTWDTQLRHLRNQIFDNIGNTISLDNDEVWIMISADRHYTATPIPSRPVFTFVIEFNYVAVTGTRVGETCTAVHRAVEKAVTTGGLACLVARGRSIYESQHFVTDGAICHTNDIERDVGLQLYEFTSNIRAHIRRSGMGDATVYVDITRSLDTCSQMPMYTCTVTM